MRLYGGDRSGHADTVLFSPWTERGCGIKYFQYHQTMYLISYLSHLRFGSHCCRRTASGAGKMKEARDTDNKMIAFSVFCCTCVAAVMFVMAPLFPRLYNTNAEARTLAKYFIMITAFFMPQNAFLHATYFTLRSGGKTIVTFLFDSVFIWVVSVTIAFTLSRFTGLPVLVIYAMVQAADMMKCVIGFILVKKGVWLQNIVS